MIELHSTTPAGQIALLVAGRESRQTELEARDLLRELEELAAALGLSIAESMLVKVGRSHPRYLVGSGTAETIAAACVAHHADVIIFDNELTPSQQRNWETMTQKRVIDRRELILDIFARRASTREAELQIELARAEYMLPRLKRAWTHLSRQDGALGLRGGEGEKQIELDERMVRRRIDAMRRELALVRRRRAEQRKQRRKKPVPTAAIVGYTNAGKSSLLNRLTKADTLVEDKLFATLDPLTRRVRLANNQTLLLTDTVGFVRKLPHGLVEAFKATLEEAVTSDFLIHVADLTSPIIHEQITTTNQVLKEIGAADRFTIMVFNKSDCVVEPYFQPRIRKQYPDSVFVSALTGDGIPSLLEKIGAYLDQDLQVMKLRIPPGHYDLVACLHRTSKIISKEFVEEMVHISAYVPRNHERELDQFVVS